MGRPGEAWRGKGWQAWSGEARQGLARPGLEWQDWHGMAWRGGERKVKMSPMLKRITEEDARQARREIICEIAEAVFLLGALVASIWIVLAVTGGN